LCLRVGTRGRRRMSTPIYEINKGDPPARNALPLREPRDPISTPSLALPFARSTAILFPHFAAPRDVGVQVSPPAPTIQSLSRYGSNVSPARLGVGIGATADRLSSPPLVGRAAIQPLSLERDAKQVPRWPVISNTADIGSGSARSLCQYPVTVHCVFPQPPSV
jgi:hypothetical protein